MNVLIDETTVTWTGWRGRHSLYLLIYCVSWPKIWRHSIAN